MCKTIPISSSSNKTKFEALLEEFEVRLHGTFMGLIRENHVKNIPKVTSLRRNHKAWLQWL